MLKVLSWVGIVKDLKQPPARVLHPKATEAESQPEREAVAA